MPMTEMARKYSQSCPKMDATRKKKVRTTKDNMAKDSNVRATKYGPLVGQSSGRRKGQDPVEEHGCCSPLGDDEDKSM